MYRVKSLVGIKSEVAVVKNRHADINIFTVASGLLYEVSLFINPIKHGMLRIANSTSVSPQS
jgi:hypothetical protein